MKVCVQLWSALVNFLLFDHYLAKHECPSLHFQLHFTVGPTGPENAFWLASSDVPLCGTALFFNFYDVSPSLVPLSSSFSLCLLPSTIKPCNSKVKLRQNKMQNWWNVIGKNLTLDEIWRLARCSWPWPLHTLFLFYSYKGQISPFNQSWATMLLEI